MGMLKDLEGLHFVGLKELEKINSLISETLRNALNRNGNAYIILGKVNFFYFIFLTKFNYRG